MKENTVKAKSVSDFIQLIEDKYQNLTDEEEFFNLWFRAEENANYE